MVSFLYPENQGRNRPRSYESGFPGKTVYG